MEETVFSKTAGVLELDEETIKKAWDHLRVLNISPDDPEVVIMLNNFRTEQLVSKLTSLMQTSVTEMRGVSKQIVSDAREEAKKEIKVFVDSAGKIVDALNSNAMEIIKGINNANEENCNKITEGVARSIGPRLDNIIESKIKQKNRTEIALLVCFCVILSLAIGMFGYVIGSSVNGNTSGDFSQFLNSMSPYTLIAIGAAGVLFLWFLVNILRQWKFTRSVFGLKPPKVD